MSDLKSFESRLLKEFTARTRLNQKLSLKTCRQFAEEILAMYGDGYTPEETAKWIAAQVDPQKIKEEEFFC